MTSIVDQQKLVISLIDSYWYQHKIFTPKHLVPQPTTTPNFDQTLEDQREEKPNLMNNSMKKPFCDQSLSSKHTLNSSPKSVLAPHLQTILSGKEFGDVSDDSSTPKKKQRVTVDTQKGKKIRSRRGKNLSELEFEEVKGFKDLGFVFSDDDNKDMKLVSIVPGLAKNHVDTTVSRPYLSEAWDCMKKEEERKKREMSVIKPLLVDLKNEYLGNHEVEFKDHLRVWAHTVASIVR